MGKQEEQNERVAANMLRCEPRTLRRDLPAKVIIERRRDQGTRAATACVEGIRSLKAGISTFAALQEQHALKQ